MVLRIINRMRDFAAWCRLHRMPTVSISGDSKVAYRAVHIKDGCNLRIGSGSIVEGSISFDKNDASVTIGDRVFIGASAIVCANRIDVGDDVLISWGCTIVDHNSHATDWKNRSSDVRDWFNGSKDWRFVKTAPVTIGSRSWLGFNVSILKGVTIGEGAVVGACSVVTKDVPPYTIVAGNPARIIRGIAQDE